MKTLFRSVVLLFITFASAWTQTAQDGLRIMQKEIGFGARNLAAGGNGVVSASDYSAIYWNPAGLAGLNKSEFMGEISHLRFSNDALFANTLTGMEESFNHLRTAGFALSLPASRGSLVLAAGYHFVADFDEYLFFNGFNSLSNGLEFELENENGSYNWYNFDKNVQQSEEVITRGGLHQWSFGGALALSPSFDFGLALNFWNGKEEYLLNFRQKDIDNIYNIYPADFDSYALNQDLVSEYKAFSLKAGGMFKLNQAMRLGVAMEFPKTFTINENYAASDELIFDDGYVDAVEFEPGEWKYKLKTPYRFDAGLGIKVSPVQLTASMTYRDWTQTRFQKPDEFVLDADYSELLSENQAIQRNYRETINYHLGGEILMPASNLALRAGYAVYPSALKEASSDLDRKVYSGGIGIKIGLNTYLDATYMRSNYSKESEDIYTPGGTLEEISENRIFLSLRLQF